MGETVIRFYFSRGSAARQAKIAHFYTFLLVRVVFLKASPKRILRTIIKTQDDFAQFVLAQRRLDLLKKKKRLLRLFKSNGIDMFARKQRHRF